MKELRVSQLISLIEPFDLESVMTMMEESVPAIPLGETPWESYPYRPDVSFRIAWLQNIIYLHYAVAEREFKAEKLESNQMVCEDSCVEFFFSPFPDGIYYNFEFNAIGTCLLSAGRNRTERSYASREIIGKMTIKSTMGDKAIPFTDKQTQWKIVIAIPTGTLWLHDIKELSGLSAMANFYKCGDRLQNRHYLTWSPVSSNRPDFHRPEYFGKLIFV